MIDIRRPMQQLHESDRHVFQNERADCCRDGADSARAPWEDGHKSELDSTFISQQVNDEQLMNIAGSTAFNNTIDFEMLQDNFDLLENSELLNVSRRQRGLT
jgi:hypothetical protein